MLSKNFLSKTLNSISVLAVSGVLLGSALTSSSWAMAELPEEHLDEAVAVARTIHDQSEWNKSQYKNIWTPKDCKDLLSFRTTSIYWKDAVDTFIVRDRVFMYTYNPSKPINEIGYDVFPLVTCIMMDRLNENQVNSIKSFFKPIENKLSNIVMLNCSTQNDKACKAIGPVLPYFSMLRTIQICDGHTSRSGFKEVIDGLDTQENLVELHLSSQFDKNDIPGKDEIMAMADKLTKLKSLRSFYIGNLSSIQKEDMDYLKKKIEDHKLLYKSGLEVIVEVTDFY